MDSFSERGRESEYSQMIGWVKSGVSCCVPCTKRGSERKGEILKLLHPVKHPRNEYGESLEVHTEAWLAERSKASDLSSDSRE